MMSTRTTEQPRHTHSDQRALDRPAGTEPDKSPKKRGKLAAVWDTLGAVVGAVMGVLPHVLHHVGLIAGAALVTGAAGNALFFAVGLVFSIPMLRRLYRRFRTWRAPAIAIAIFGALFSLSAFVIGPVLTGGSASQPGPPSPSSSTTTPSHSEHHTG